MTDTVMPPSKLSQPAQGYAGNIAPELAWQWVQTGQAVMVDVRTDAERDGASAPGAIAVAWKWPTMQANADFDAQLACCRAARGQGCAAMSQRRALSGRCQARRRAEYRGLTTFWKALKAMWTSKGQRGFLGGWRKRGLPWSQ